MTYKLRVLNLEKWMLHSNLGAIYTRIDPIYNRKGWYLMRSEDITNLLHESTSTRIQKLLIEDNIIKIKNHRGVIEYFSWIELGNGRAYTDKNLFERFKFEMFWCGSSAIIKTQKELEAIDTVLSMRGIPKNVRDQLWDIHRGYSIPKCRTEMFRSIKLHCKKARSNKNGTSA